jgi:phospholipid/cholesterol/gamma-HCH transport system substrate-binding protein
MRYKNEVLVGLAIVLAVIVGILGVRFLEGLPLLGGGYSIVAIFDDAQGMTSGSPVRVSGVRVGQVESVSLGEGSRHVVARLAISPGVEIPRGSTVSTTGLAALGDVSVSITPGPPRLGLLGSGDTLYARPSPDLLAMLQDNAERLFGEADTLLTAAAGTFTTAEAFLGETQGDLRQTIAALRGTTTTVDQILRAERARLASTLANLEAASADAAFLTADARRFTATHADSIALAVSGVNRTLVRVDHALGQLETTTTQLDEILFKINTGQGTIGLMLNEPTLYYNLEAAVANLNQIMADFQADPARYLREVRLFSLF